MVQKKRDNADNQMTELFPYDIPKVDELKKQLLKVYFNWTKIFFKN